MTETVPTNEAQALTPNRLRTAVLEDAAIRFVARLQPAGGRGDKVFPPTYTGGQYALESRVDEHGVVKDVVLLDSVQSQANRMEQALLAAHRAGRVTLPMVSVNFSNSKSTGTWKWRLLKATDRMRSTAKALSASARWSWPTRYKPLLTYQMR